MTRTPDEIKKGLECCIDGNIECDGNCVFDDEIGLCYPNCVKLLMKNALALIQQLQDDLQLEKKRTDALAMELAVLKNAKKQLEDHLREATKKIEHCEFHGGDKLVFENGVIKSTRPVCLKEVPCPDFVRKGGPKPHD